MKATIFGENSDKVRELAVEAGFDLVEDGADFIITYGGDGTLMRSEGKYPGVPKIALKNSYICKKCLPIPNEEVLEKVRRSECKIERLMKLEAQAKGQRLTCMNEFTLHNYNPRHAIRYAVDIDANRFHKEIIGDGVVVATPFGSTGYYRSIADSFFEVGIGLAFNNSTEQADHMVLKEDSTIILTITRGPAEIFADNHQEAISLAEGDVVTIRKSDDHAQIVVPL